MKKSAASKRPLVGRVVLVSLAIIIGIGNSPFVAHALDNSYTWSKLAYGDAYPTQSGTSADGHDSVIAGDTTAISHDSGQSWQSLSATLGAIPGNTRTNWYKIAVMSSNGQIVGIVNADAQLFTSSDSGATWTLKSTLAAGITSLAMSADGTKLAAATGSALYTSGDGGSTWVERSDGSVSSTYYKTVVMSADGQTLIATTEDPSYSNGADSGISRSVDGGVTWTQNSSTAPLGLYNLKLSGNGQLAIAQSYDGAIQLSADGGVTWNQVHAAPVTGDTFNLFVSADGGTAMAFDGYTRFKSTDHGQTWVSQTSNGDVWARGAPGSASADLSIIVSGESDFGDLFASQDGGMTWKIPLLEGGKWWASMATTTDGSTVLLTDADGHIYVSHDHGTTWRFGYDVSADGDTTGGDLWGTAVSSDGSHMVVSDEDSQGTTHLYTSSDGGATWSKNAPAGANDWYDVALSADGSKIAALTASGDVYLSSNFGASWTTVTSLEHTFPSANSQQMKIVMSPNGTHLAVSEDGLNTSYDSTANSWVYSGTNYLYTSADSGSTWTQHATPVDSGPVSIQDLAMSSDGQTLAFVTYGGNSHLYLSKDGGSNWSTDPGTGLPAWNSSNNSADNYNQISMSSDGQVVATSDFSHANTYVTTDGGGAWETYSNNDPTSTTSGSGVVATAVSGDGTQIYVATNNVYRGTLPSSGAGSGSSSSSLPSAPQQTIATPTSSSDLNVTWRSPATQGSSPLTAYRIRYRLAGTSNWIQAAQTDASTYSYTITGLNPNTAYDVQVIAVNALGDSVDVPSQTNDAIATVTTLSPGQTAPITSGSLVDGLAETGTNVWIFGGLGAVAIVSGVLVLRRFSKR